MENNPKVEQAKKELSPFEVEAVYNIDYSLDRIHMLAVSFENVGNPHVAQQLRMAFARIRTGLITLKVPSFTEPTDEQKAAMGAV